MEDKEICDLYFNRDEAAIEKTNEKYGSWCRGIAGRILENREESEECVSDTYLTVWNHIPPERPNVFRAWIGKITRNLALSRGRRLSAAKRGKQVTLALDELRDCVSGRESVETAMEQKEIAAVLGRFLSELGRTQRNIFLRRYWYLSPIAEIADVYHMTESRVTSMLFRSRKKLRRMLEEEGIAL